jgi:rhodanese-related sulfurtransferase
MRLSVFALVAACLWMPAAQAAKKDTKLVAVADVKAALDKGEKVVVVDANNKSTRTKKGIVPGAVLLTHYKTFPMSELPADKDQRLIFYCASERCRASYQAAARASDAGYKDVAVMNAGIAGWTNAGYATAKANEAKPPAPKPAPKPAPTSRADSDDEGGGC